MTSLRGIQGYLSDRRIVEPRGTLLATSTLSGVTDPWEITFPRGWPILYFEGGFRTNRSGAVNDGVTMRVGSGSIDTGGNYYWLQDRLGSSPSNGVEGTSWTIGQAHAANATASTNATFRAVLYQWPLIASGSAWNRAAAKLVIQAATDGESDTHDTYTFGGWVPGSPLLGLDRVNFRGATGSMTAPSTIAIYGHRFS